MSERRKSLYAPHVVHPSFGFVSYGHAAAFMDLDGRTDCLTEAARAAGPFVSSIARHEVRPELSISPSNFLPVQAQNQRVILGKQSGLGGILQ